MDESGAVFEISQLIATPDKLWETFTQGRGIQNFVADPMKFGDFDGGFQEVDRTVGLGPVRQ